MLSLFFITGFLREFQTCSLDIQTCSLHFTFDSEIVLYFIPRKQWRDAYKELCIRMLKLEPCYKNKNWKNLTHQKKKSLSTYHIINTCACIIVKSMLYQHQTISQCCTALRPRLIVMTVTLNPYFKYQFSEFSTFQPTFCQTS